MIDRLVAVAVIPWWLVAASGWACWVTAYHAAGLTRPEVTR